MLEKLTEIENRYLELQGEMIKPENLSNRELQSKLGKEFKSLEPVVMKFRELKLLIEDLATAIELLIDATGDDKTHIESEKNELESRYAEIEEEIRALLIPSDPRDSQPVIFEIRAGTGGEEAALFVMDLFEMYSRYAERVNFKLEVVNIHGSDMKGAKEIVFTIDGPGAFSKLRYEAGTHRVQRVPDTESQGRIHTSAVTVAVLSEPDDVDIEIKTEDLRVDTYRSSGAGGQHVNKTSSAIRITHIPTGLVVTCQDQRSQHQNKDKAMRILKAHLIEAEEEKQTNETVKSRRSMVGSGDRSEKIRTYNYPQSRVTDHRIGFTSHNIQAIMLGDLDALFEALQIAAQAAAMAVGDKK
ncbi:MAG: peptide chain release factor 1 [bacterium]